MKTDKKTVSQAGLWSLLFCFFFSFQSITAGIVQIPEVDDTNSLIQAPDAFERYNTAIKKGRKTEDKVSRSL